MCMRLFVLGRPYLQKEEMFARGGNLGRRWVVWVAEVAALTGIALW